MSLFFIIITLAIMALVLGTVINNLGSMLESENEEARMGYNPGEFDLPTGHYRCYDCCDGDLHPLSHQYDSWEPEAGDAWNLPAGEELEAAYGAILSVESPHLEDFEIQEAHEEFLAQAKECGCGQCDDCMMFADDLTEEASLVTKEAPFSWGEGEIIWSSPDSEGAVATDDFIDNLESQIRKVISRQKGLPSDVLYNLAVEELIALQEFLANEDHKQLVISCFGWVCCLKRT